MKSHAFDPFSFVSGVVALAIGLALLVDFDLSGVRNDWILPVGLLLVGAGIVIKSIRNQRSRSGRDEV